MTAERVDLGGGVTGEWIGWSPDRAINPQHEGIADIEKCCLVLEHKTPSGEPHEGIITVERPGTRRVFPSHPLWQVQSEEPLTLTPSVLCSCGWHGFVTNGKWVAC